ncbi:MAG: hypothetical protein M5U15_08185 [Kiritimatiellae bacterium]|nr:hypothetical protein [Kiritimatiellia bacterium]
MPLVADSCIEGGYVGGSNIYTNDPNFVNGWRLEGAQSVDIINYTASDVIYDIDGEFRGEYADLGADEWVVDSDGDGLPDWWEIANGLDPFDDGTIDPANGYGADPDNDGWNNAQEMRAGTLATNSDTDGDGVIDSYDPEPLIFNCFIEQQISFNLQAFDKPFADGSGAPVYAGSVFATPVFPSIVATITQVRLTGHVDDCFKINNQEYAWGRASEIFQEDITDSVLDRKAGRFRVDVYDYIDNGWQNNEVHLLDSGAGPAGALCTIRYLTGLRVEIVLPQSQACDGEQVDVDLVVTPSSAKSYLSAVQFTATKPGGGTQFDSPSGQGITISQRSSAITEWSIDNARWYSTQADHCNATAEYELKATYSIGSSECETAPVIFTADTTYGACLSGLAWVTQLWSGNIQITAVQLTNGQWEATISQNTFSRNVQASSTWTAPANSQYHDTVRDEEQFHEGQYEGTTSTIVNDLWDDQLVMNAATANQPFIATTEAQARAAAQAAFNVARSQEEARSLALDSVRTCDMEREAKTAVGASHRAAMPCTYPNCP